MRKLRNQTVRTPQETHSLLKRIKQTSVVLSDLDGLLVNSENFHQVFVHRTSKAWMQSTISRVIKSDLHLQKFIQVLIKFIVTERHPEWARHALVWLRFLLSNFPIPRSKWSVLKHVVAPLLNHANEMTGLHDLYVRAALRGSTVERWNMRTQKLLGKNGILSSTGLFFDSSDKIPSTGYVFVDDSDEELSVKRRTRSRQQSCSDALPRELDMKTEEGAVLEEEGEGSVLLGDDSDDDEASVDEGDPSWDDSDQDEDESEDQLDPLAATPSDSDHGVFDVNDTASSSSRERESDDDDDCDDDDDDDDEKEDEEEEKEDNEDDGEPSRLRSGAGNSDLNSSDSSCVSGSETDEETKFLLLGRQINPDIEEPPNPSHLEARPKRTSAQSVRRATPRKKQRTSAT